MDVNRVSSERDCVSVPSYGDTLLSVEQLKVNCRTGGGRLLRVIDEANFSVSRNEAVGIVGESGSGKTMLCRSLIGTLPRHRAVLMSGKILFDGIHLEGAPERLWRRIRGRRIGYVPQSSLAGLNPLLTVGTQLVEAITAVQRIGWEEARREAVALLDLVRVPRAREVLQERPHQLSGGMRQRVMIASAIAQKPALLIADEPTTALDVSVQRQILSLIATVRRELGMTLILVSHDLAVVEEVCDRLVVMYAGACVEVGPLEAVLGDPRHPYTLALRLSRIDLAVPGQDLEAIPGEATAAGSWPEGCRFWPRCRLADDLCRHGSQPPLLEVSRQQSACIHAERMSEWR